MTTPSLETLQCCANAFTVESDDIQLALIAAQANSLTANREFYAATANDLPDLYTSNLPNGQIVFVNDIKVPVVASNCVWIGLDGRELRSDVPEILLYTWGCNNGGQLGTDTIVSRSSPGTTAGGGTTWCQVSSSYTKTTAIKTDGTLWTWGCNNNGQLGDNSIAARSSPGTTAGGGTNWCQVSAGRCHTAAVKTDGTLWTWGYNYFGRLGNNSTLARSSPGTTVGGGFTWCQVSAGYSHTAAVKTDGTLWTWGLNSNGRLGDNSTVSRLSPGTTAGGGTDWRQVSVDSHTAAIKTDGTLWTWGANFSGLLGDNSTVSRSSPGTTAGGGTTWCQVCSGIAGAAIKTDGTLWTWGSNASGRLGNGTTTSRSSPGTTAGGGTTWCQVGGFGGAVKTDGTLWTWGDGDSGRIGNNSTVASASPVTTAGGGTSWSQVSAAARHTTAIAIC